MKKFICLFIIFGIICFSGAAVFGEDKKEETQEKPRVAVMDLEAKGLTQEEAEAVADFLRTDLLNTEKFTVVERSRVKDILKEQQFSLSGVTDTEKATKIGKLLNCKLIVVGTLSKLGAKYFLNVRAVDVETGETKLGKRESTSTLEELSEVSRVIAQQLAGMKVTYRDKGTGATPYTGDQVEYNSPPLGFDVQFGFSPKYTRYHDFKVSNSFGDYNQTETMSPSFFDFKLGAYFSLLYVGLMSKSVKMDANEDVEIHEEESSTFTNYSIDYTSKSYETTVSINDLMLGIRLFQPGNLNYSVIYFSWKSILFDNHTLSSTLKFSGPTFGFMGKLGGGERGCCGGGRLSSSPVSLFIDYGLFGGFLTSDQSMFLGGEKAFGFNFGGELGFGVMLRKIGLYTLFNYNLDALVYTYKDVLGTTTYTESHLFHGFEIRIGYTFDMQVLFH